MQTILTKKDITAALSVSFLTIAAGAAFGVWTGVGATIGMLSMAIASIVGVVFGGSPVKTSGPTGPTAGLMFATVAALSAANVNPDLTMLILMTAALLLFLISFFGVDKLLDQVPYVCIAVFVNGISLFIIYKQLIKVTQFSDLPISGLLWESGLALGTFLLLNLWPKIIKISANLPGINIISGSLASMIIGGLLVFIFSPEVTTLKIAPINFDELLPDLSFMQSDWSLLFLSFLTLKAAFILALVTLITAKALYTKVDYKRELRNQSLANAAVAAIGGIPVTIGFVRTKLLQRAGATSLLSGVLVGLFVIIALVFFDFILAYIPTSIFIGILVKAGISSLDFQVWREYSIDKRSLFPVCFVFVGSVAIIWLDIVLVFLASIIVWIVLSKLSLFKNYCGDIKKCPCVD